MAIKRYVIMRKKTGKYLSNARFAVQHHDLFENSVDKCFNQKNGEYAYKYLTKDVAYSIAYSFYKKFGEDFEVVEYSK